MWVRNRYTGPGGGLYTGPGGGLYTGPGGGAYTGPDGGPVSYTHLDVYKRQDMENANLICFLASDEASYISGQNIQIDGCRKKL